VSSAVPVVDPALLPSMTVAELREVHRTLFVRLRDIEHWHRLVAARLDLAVAAVTDLEEPGVPLPAGLCTDTEGDALHALLGIPRSEGRLAESGRLLNLRSVLRELELCTRDLQVQLSRVAQELADRHPERVVLRLPRPREAD
jgi:hypothetical protein